MAKVDNIVFKLWLEYDPFDKGEAAYSEWDLENDFCNIGVDMQDGRCYGINVWTYRYLHTAIEEGKTNGEHLSGSYISPPDLLVKDLRKETLEAVITDLLSQGDLEWMLNPSVFGICYQFPWTEATAIADEITSLEQRIETSLPAGHILHNTKWRINGIRKDTSEVSVKTKDHSIVLLQMNTAYNALRSTTLFDNEPAFWREKLRLDIATASNSPL